MIARVRWAVLLLIAAAAIAPAPAAAQAPFTQADVDAAAAVARELWRSSECYARERLEWVTAEQLDHGPGSEDGKVAAARAPVHGYRYGCPVRIVAERHGTLVELCTTLAHEFGHLAGEEHVADPSSLMYGDGRPPDPSTCVEHFGDSSRPPLPVTGPPNQPPSGACIIAAQRGECAEVEVCIGRGGHWRCRRFYPSDRARARSRNQKTRKSAGRSGWRGTPRRDPQA